MKMFDRLPPLNSLRAFDAAQRHMSFQKAANELNVTPAALSYQIRQLEDHLGVKLFERLNRAVALTDEGLAIAPGIEDSFALLRRTMARLSRKRADNVLVISAGPAFTSKWLVPRLYRFLACHPTIDLRISSSLAVVDLLVDDVDIGLRFGRGIYPGCKAIRLMDECLTPMCSPLLLEGENALKTPADLASHILIYDETHIGQFKLPSWRDWLEAAGVSSLVPQRAGPHFDIADNAIDAAIAGAGVVLGRTVLARADIKAGRLVAPFDLRLKADFAFYAAIAENRIDEPNIRHFLDWIMDEINGKYDREVPEPAT